MESSIELPNGLIIGVGGGTNLRRTQTMSVEPSNGSMADSKGGSDLSSTKTLSMMEHLSLELLEDGLDSFRTIHIRNEQDNERGTKNNGNNGVTFNCYTQTTTAVACFSSFTASTAHELATRKIT